MRDSGFGSLGFGGKGFRSLGLRDSGFRVSLQEGADLNSGPHGPTSGNIWTPLYPQLKTHKAKLATEQGRVQIPMSAP